MGKNLTGKLGFIVAVLAIFIYGIFYGTSLPHSGPMQSLKNGNIHLGLDLKGGTHLVLKVHVDEAINTETNRAVQALNEDLASKGGTASKLDLAHADVITVSVPDSTKMADVKSAIGDTAKYPGYDVTQTATGFTMTLTQAQKSTIDATTVDKSIETIRQRIDSLGTLDPMIEKYGLGEDEILLELPGIDDPSRVAHIIETTPKLEIHEVVGTSYPDEAQALASVNGVLPVEEMLVKGSASGSGPEQVWVLKRLAVVEGTDFKGATPQQDENGRPDISFNLTTEAGDRFYKYTDANKGTGSMAIVLDNRVLEVATIQSAIRDEGRITGGFTQEEAMKLSKQLSSGSIPATISYLETRSIGPSLGSTSIHHGVNAAIAGMLAVMIFMLIYYKGAGINADLALFLNLVILLGFMGFAGATLTLPGIAGVILTIGMGVDSNVLIFERIKEELRLGKTAAAAIKDGFAHAWVTIVDTHVTTVVSALILLMFGTGPVKGFAVTLIFGLLANIFTAVFVSRVIFDWLLSRKTREAVLSI